MMKKTLILFTLMLPFLGQSQAISFLRSYGNSGYDYACDVKQDVDSGYVVVGSSSSFTPDNGDAYILKVDTLGNQLWSYNYGGQGADWAMAVEVTIDETYALAGYTNSYGAGGFDFYLVRADAAGVPIWEKTYGGSDWDRAFNMQEMPDSGFVLVGESHSFNNGVGTGYAVRVDKFGDTLWTFSHPSLTEESFYKDVALDGDTLIICGGIADGGNNTYDGLIIKMHVDKTVGWIQTVGQADNDYFNTVFAVNAVHTFAGVTTTDYTNRKEDTWIYRLQDDRTFINEGSYPTSNFRDDGINDIYVRDFNQDVYYAGYSASFGFGNVDGFSDFFTGKYSFGGFNLAYNNYGEAGVDEATGIDLTYDNGVIICGNTEHYQTGGHNILLLKLGQSWTYPDQFNDLTFEDLTLSVEDFENDLSTGFNIYPNPAEQILTIESDFTIQSVQIYDRIGKMVYTESSPGQSINLSDLNSGIYILQFQIEGKNYRKKLIIK